MEKQALLGHLNIQHCWLPLAEHPIQSWHPLLARFHRKKKIYDFVNWLLQIKNNILCEKKRVVLLCCMQLSSRFIVSISLHRARSRLTSLLVPNFCQRVIFVATLHLQYRFSLVFQDKEQLPRILLIDEWIGFWRILFCLQEDSFWERQNYRCHELEHEHFMQYVWLIARGVVGLLVRYVLIEQYIRNTLLIIGRSRNYSFRSHTKQCSVLFWWQSQNRICWIEVR